MKKIGITLLIMLFASLTALAQQPTLTIKTETPGLPSELFYGNVKVKPVRLRPGTNPPQVITIDDIDFLIQQQYIDFLGRFPDGDGFKNWMATVGGGVDAAGVTHQPCPSGGFGENLNPTCDRVHMSAGFFQSNEFLGRGYWLLRVGYVGWNRNISDSGTGRTQPSSLRYTDEFIPGLQQIGGSNSPAQEEAAKVAYVNTFVQRSDFLAQFADNSNSTFVNTLEANAAVTLPNKQQLIDGLNASTMTRANVFRNIVESQVVFDKYIIPSFVDMEYKGYLRRDPDSIGYNNWIDTLTTDPNNFRHMVFGFLFSSEYRSRF